MERSPLSPAELAPLVGTYACAFHADLRRHPGPRGALAIHADGAYVRTDTDGSQLQAGAVVNVLPTYFGEQDVVFSGGLHYMRFIPERRTLHIVYKSKSAFECVRTASELPPSSGTYACTLAATPGKPAKHAGTLIIRPAGRYERRDSDNSLIETGTVSRNAGRDGSGTVTFTGRTTTSMEVHDGGRRLSAGPTFEMPRRLDCDLVRGAAPSP